MNQPLFGMQRLSRKAKQQTTAKRDQITNPQLFLEKFLADELEDFYASQKASLELAGSLAHGYRGASIGRRSRFQRPDACRRRVNVRSVAAVSTFIGS